MSEEERLADTQLAEDTYELMLFMSVDLTGSTSYKFSQDIEQHIDPNNEKSWRLILEQFYKGFTSSFQDKLEHWVRIFEASHPKSLSNWQAPKIWKALGDELIFEVEVKNTIQVFAAIEGFKDALQHETRKIKNSSDKLGLKGSAWLADFPGMNAKISLDWDKEEENRKTKFDYIGPAIDTGFRLGKEADRRRMPISIELAYILSYGTTKVQAKSLSFGYSGRQNLKGVLQDRDYPIFWIDVECEELERNINSAEQKLYPKNKNVDPDDVLGFSEKFILGSKWLELPYLKEETDFCSSPPVSAIKFSEKVRENKKVAEKEEKDINESILADDDSSMTKSVDDLLGKMKGPADES